MAAETKTDETFPKDKTVLVLGCGMCVPALTRYFNDNGLWMIIATRTTSKADPVIAKVEKKEMIRVEQLDISASDFAEKLDALAKLARVMISMLPYAYHAKAAEIAINNKVDFASTSYVQDGVQALHDKAVEAGVILLNECGVDPGLDHMSAMKIIDDAKAKGGKVFSFYSICGGLPAPAANDNPFGYKFSWAPRGVLLASRNGAQYIKGGEQVVVEKGTLFQDKHVRQEKIANVGDCEWYLNRDSESYIKIYGLEGIDTIIRGTYRYPGWCKTLLMIADLKLTSDDKIDIGGKTYLDYLKLALKVPEDGNPVDAIKAVIAKTGAEWDAKYDEAVERLKWVGLFSDEVVPKDVDNSLDALCHIFKQKLVYKPGEKDMLILKHQFQIEYDDRTESVESLMLDFGLQNENDKDWADSYSSMCRTVGLPIACAVRRIITGDIKATGVVRPTTKDIYVPILKDMEALGVKFVETVTVKPKQ